MSNGKEWRRWAVPAALALIVVTTAVTLSRSRVVGLYHDDGIYLATARALSETGTYALVSVPESPAATKYPPAYPVALAVWGRAAPAAVAPEAWAKGLSFLALGALTMVMWQWLGCLPGATRAMRGLGALLVGLNPGLLSHVDLLLSDVLFVAISTAALFVSLEGPSDRADARRAVLSGLLAGLASLTRELGLVVLLVILVRAGLVQRWRDLAVTACVAAVCLAPWWLWRAGAPPVTNALLQYYVSYEAQAWRHLFAEPGMLGRILTSNAWFFATSAGLVLGLPGILWTAAGLAMAALGAWRLRASPTGQLATLTIAVYLGAVLGHPYPMARYLLPLVPLFWILAVGGLIGAVRPGIREGVLVLFLAPVLLWIRLYATLPPDALHGGFGRPVAYPVTGFREAADWIRQCVARERRLASAHDPYYYLATGRQAIRPWIHRPEHYTPAYGRYLEGAGAVTDVQMALDALGIEVLIRDPLLEGGEGEYGRRSLDALITRTPVSWSRVWASTDGLHQVFVRSGLQGVVSDAPSCDRSNRSGSGTLASPGNVTHSAAPSAVETTPEGVARDTSR